MAVYIPKGTPSCESASMTVAWLPTAARWLGVMPQWLATFSATPAAWSTWMTSWCPSAGGVVRGRGAGPVRSVDARAQFDKHEDGTGVAVARCVVRRAEPGAVRPVERHAFAVQTPQPLGIADACQRPGIWHKRGVVGRHGWAPEDQAEVARLVPGTPPVSGSFQSTCCRPRSIEGAP